MVVRVLQRRLFAVQDVPAAQDASMDATAGLQCRSRSMPYLAISALNVAISLAGRSRTARPALREVLTQRLRLLDTGLGQQLRQHGHTRSAARAAFVHAFKAGTSVRPR